MKKLEDIGFYTLSDARAANVSEDSPMWRCELIVTDRCNFSCPYCRGSNYCDGGDINHAIAIETLERWISQGLKNVRFSGGEPTLNSNLCGYVRMCKAANSDNIAISTNGSQPLHVYRQLEQLGVSDFSISLDACCAQVGEKMAGRDGVWQIIIDNIREIARTSYVTVGMVFTEENVEQAREAVLFAESLGVADIRVIPSAQYNKALYQLFHLPAETLAKFPILRYRIERLRNNKYVRALDGDCPSKCYLPIDDSVVAGDSHYPCVIYMREGGKPIGKVGQNMRAERVAWSDTHVPREDPICSDMCLDVCMDYNCRASKKNERGN